MECFFPPTLHNCLLSVALFITVLLQTFGASATENVGADERRHRLESPQVGWWAVSWLQPEPPLSAGHAARWMDPGWSLPGAVGWRQTLGTLRLVSEPCQHVGMTTQGSVAARFCLLAWAARPSTELFPAFLSVGCLWRWLSDSAAAWGWGCSPGDGCLGTQNPRRGKWCLVTRASSLRDLWRWRCTHSFWMAKKNIIYIHLFNVI